MSGEDNAKLHQILEEAFELRKRKDADYGSSWKRHGDVGLVVRLSDKIERLNSLVFDKKLSQVKSESVRDTAIDVINYAAMLALWIDDNKGA